MSTVPAEIAGIGSTQQKLRVSPGFDPLKAAVGPEEYFVLSRIDGSQTVRELLLTTGLPVDRSVQIISRLRAIGALLLPHEKAPVPPPAAPTQPIRTSGSGAMPAISRTMTPTRRPPPVDTPPLEVKPSHDLALPEPTSDELAALAESNALADGERRRILAMARLARGSDLYALLGVPQGATARMLKLAYFQLSKEIHPDRYYGKKLGTFAERMSFVFDAASRAYSTLTGTSKARGSSSHATVPQNEQPQTPQEYAAELFDRACQLEVGGDALEAMKLFAAAVRVDPQPRYLRRAASCALAAEQPRSAVEYAKKAHALAPTDASSARLLASAFRAAGKLADAEEVLVMAMALKNENDVLTSELRNDLAEVRRLLAQ